MEDINNLTPSEIRSIINKKIGKFFGACSVAFVNIENKYFLDLVSTLLSIRPEKVDYHAPSRQTFSNTIIPSVREELDVAKKRLLSGTDSIMMVDGWKNKSNNKKFLVFTLRNKNAHQVFLSFHDSSEESEHAPIVGNNIVEAIQLASDLYNTRVVGVITDNDTKIKAGVNVASDILIENQINEKSLMISTCYSHSGNLLLKTIVEENFAVDLREVVNSFSSPKMTSLIYNYGGCKLKNYPDTRFCFVRLTCETILKSLEALRLIIAEDQYRNDIPGRVLDLIEDETGNFERQLWSTINWSTPICKIINRCQDPSKNVADGTEYWLNLRLNNNLHLEEIEDRIGHAIHPVGYAANLMHPVYKGERLDDDQRTSAMNFLKYYLDETGRGELEMFLTDRNEADVVADNVNDSYYYWSIKELLFPNLAALCKKIMLFPASTSLLEGFFSQWTYVHNKYRNRLSNNTTGILIDLYHLAKHLDGEIWINTVKKKRQNYVELDDDL